MTVTSTTSATASTAAAATKSDKQLNALNYDSFLKLLLQQMKSQDPTKPVDQTQMLAQLASFSNVGQTIKLNEKLDQLLQSSGAQMGAAIIGKTITSLVDQQSGVVKSIEITSSGTVAKLDNGLTVDLASGFSIQS